MPMQLIPLNKLVVSPRNVRRKDRKADIEALAASIASRGLLQNLCVVATDGDRYEVDAGGRRHLALKLLAKTGMIAKDFPVPCNVVSREEGREVSLVENVHRVAMDAMDEVDAFAALVADGATADEVAQRFGVTRRHVDQRLALSGLSPKIKAAWKRGDITLEAARAFCLADDYGQQDAVFRSLSKPITHPSSVRARLMDGRVRASDRLAVFVGLEAYEAAGGKLLRDLFDEESVFIDNPALLTKLAEDKLAGARAEWLTAGWNWVDLHLGEGRADRLSTTRLHPEWRDPTVEEQAELDRISGELEKLDADLDAGSEEDDARWSQRDDLEAVYETVRQAARYWSDDIKQLAGVMLSIAHDGSIAVTEGLVRVEDEKRVAAFLKSRKEGKGDSEDGVEDTGQSPARVSALPKSVNKDLTLARTRAIRQNVSGDADVALALCVASLALRCFHHTEMAGVALSAQVRPIEDLPELEEARSLLETTLPDNAADMLDWALDLSRERLLSVLAVLVASSIDLTHEDTSSADLAKQARADQLAQHLDIDMRVFWTAGHDYWLRLPKAALLAAAGDAPSMADRSARAREDALKTLAKLRKDDLAGKVAGLLEGVGYLPEILLTPIAAGVFEVTTEGLAAGAGAVAIAAE